MSIDYEIIRLIDLIIKERGFEKAAEKLKISQSAVSQRIKVFEKNIGELVLIRSVPPKATTFGQRLLLLLNYINLIENDFLHSKNEMINIPISVNADSLAIWFLPVVKSLLDNSLIRLNIQINDESISLNKLVAGEVVGAISSQNKPITGGQCDYIGAFEYIFVASPLFAERFFPNGVTRQSLINAPIVAFSETTDIHQQFLQEYFDIDHLELCTHIVPSSESYVQLIMQHSACCMIPKQQILHQLEKGTIINLLPNLIQRRELFWHRYDVRSQIMEQLTENILCYSKVYLSD